MGRGCCWGWTESSPHQQTLQGLFFSINLFGKGLTPPKTETFGLSLYWLDLMMLEIFSSFLDSMTLKHSLCGCECLSPSLPPMHTRDVHPCTCSRNRSRPWLRDQHYSLLGFFSPRAAACAVQSRAGAGSATAAPRRALAAVPGEGTAR